MAINGIKRRLGFSGEGRAVRFLKKNGYKIAERNFKTPFGEVDIIASKGQVLAFIEVKTRTSDAFGQPNEAVRGDRRRRYINAADAFGQPNEAVRGDRRRRYINAARYYFSGRTIDVVVRFDIIEVYKGSINHIENAFTA